MKIIANTKTGYLINCTPAELKKIAGQDIDFALGAELSVVDVWTKIEDIQREKQRLLDLSVKLHKHATNVESVVTELSTILQGAK